jgi:hypothetical protein
MAFPSTAALSAPDAVMASACTPLEHAPPRADDASPAASSSSPAVETTAVGHVSTCRKIAADTRYACDSTSDRDAQPQSVNSLTIAHSAENGTTITGDTRSFASAIRALGGWRWSRESSCWFRLRSRGASIPSAPLERWADRLRAAGANVIVAPVVQCTDDEARAIRQRIAGERAERLTARAARVRAAGAVDAARADAIMSRIPMGQPILVGHHSERRHRKDVARIDAALTRAHDSREYADRLTERAAKNAAIATAEHNPDAGAVREALCGQIRKCLKRDVGATSVTCSSKLVGTSIYWVRFAQGLPVQISVSDAGARVLVALTQRAAFPGPDCYPLVVRAVRALVAKEPGNA